MIKYGLTQQDMQEYRSAFKTACECTAGIPEAKADWFGYYMAQMAQTYRTRKANKERRVRRKAHARWREERERINAEVLKFDLAKVEERVHAWMACDGLAIQQGRGLPVDNYLQGRLMG